MTELAKHIGADVDVPAGDIGTGAREIGYMFGQYKRLRNEFTGVLTGKGLSYGGSLARKQATGYGLCYFTNEILKAKGDSFEGKRVVVSGSGNVATYAAEKAMQLGGKVITMSDSAGYVVDENGINLDVIKQLKEVERARISEYANRVEGAKFVEGCHGIWTVKCDIALPCATQNEINLEDAKALVAGGTKVVCEGANMPCTPEAIELFISSGLDFGPAKAANAGGVATSGLEMSQNSMRYSWTAEEVDAKLNMIMKNIYKAAYDASVEYGVPGNLLVGANIAGFLKVAESMKAQGIAY
jgi:glutamate dehydrogenase (NADP+)